jgi:hypothetical protein
MSRERTIGENTAALAPAMIALLLACGGGGGGGPPAPAVLPANGKFDYQISGAYAPELGVSVVDRDRNDDPVPGMYNVCYVNAFQTQPAENGVWRTNHPDLLLRKDGAEVQDPYWPGEIVLDISTPAKREAIAAIVGTWIEGCAAKGFQAVEPDNLDSWTRSLGLLDMEDTVAMAALLARRAHAAGLAIAQKNTSELLGHRDEIGFDFAIVEECQPWGDCGAFTDSYGARWVEIEYPDEGGRENFEAACDARGSSISVIYRDRQVVPRGDPDYVYDEC